MQDATLKVFPVSAIAAAFVAVVMVVCLLWAPPVSAGAAQDLCQGAGGRWVNDSCVGGRGEPTVTGTFAAITNVLLYIMGAIAVLMIIVGGIKYVTSGGDQKGIEGAKNTILYAIIGLIVALTAYAIVNFVLTQIS